MDRGKIQYKIFQAIASCPPICMEFSAIDLFYLCRGLALWLQKFPRTKSVRGLFLKLRKNLTGRYPNLAEDIRYLLPETKD